MQSVLEALEQHYQAVNDSKFDGILPRDYEIVFNENLRRLTGRITYGQRLIEISAYHFREYGYADAVATLEHELLHLYLHTLGEPSGHNMLFKKFAEQLGIRVFHSNAYPQNRSPRHRYVFECPACGRLVFRKRVQKGNALACGLCCRAQANGHWDDRFRLRLLEKVKFA